ncbi:flagellar motor protein MotB [Brevibacillus fluminis]|uniref:Flagellar motor protein MotB n=1 Tax=Brevibacillus fluminis TaxID=511487 RepID=A0A3M8DWC1_9BACL|nr:flagellar motor protein MotB [Brevibacillus fluminis]RNB92392.1 flagellar motor protein MotB [Brevibacillus fluminis]
MAKKGRREHHEEHVDESWLIPYADLLTLLLALFIVLFASSSVDAKKFEQIMQSFNVALTGGVGVLEQPAPVPVNTKDVQTIQRTVTKGKGKSDNQEEEKSEEQKKFEAAYQKETNDLKQLQQQINDYIVQHKMTDRLQTKLSEEGLMITILDNALFASGSATIRPDARELAKEIAKQLVPLPKQVTVTGHTDTMPINTYEFPSNWDLSTKRATNFLKILLENKSLDASRFSATGKGEYHPVATNATPEGRAKNRRVELMVLRDFTDLHQPAKKTN